MCPCVSPRHVCLFLLLHGAVQEWCDESSRTRYRHTSSQAVAQTLTEVTTENERFALACAPDAGEPWTPRWSAVKKSIYYFNPKTGRRAASLDEIADLSKLDIFPDFEGGYVWEKVWIKDKEAVGFRHKTTQKVVSSFEEIHEHEALATAEPVPAMYSGWQIEWDEKLKAVQ